MKKHVPTWVATVFPLLGVAAYVCGVALAPGRELLLAAVIVPVVGLILAFEAWLEWRSSAAPVRANRSAEFSADPSGSAERAGAGGPRAAPDEKPKRMLLYGLVLLLIVTSLLGLWTGSALLSLGFLGEVLFFVLFILA